MISFPQLESRENYPNTNYDKILNTVNSGIQNDYKVTGVKEKNVENDENNEEEKIIMLHLKKKLNDADVSSETYNHNYGVKEKACLDRKIRKLTNMLEISTSFRMLDENGGMMNIVLDTDAMRCKYLKQCGFNKEECAILSKRCEIFVYSLKILSTTNDFPVDFVGKCNLIQDMPSVDGTEECGISIYAGRTNTKTINLNQNIISRFDNEPAFNKKVKHLCGTTEDSLLQTGLLQRSGQTSFGKNVVTFKMDSPIMNKLRHYKEELGVHDDVFNHDGQRRNHLGIMNYDKYKRSLMKFKEDLPVGSRCILSIQKKSGKKMNDLRDVNMTEEERSREDYQKLIYEQPYTFLIYYEIHGVLHDTVE